MITQKMINMKIGNRLALARQDRKLSQAEMADLLGITAPTYSRLERNETSIDLEKLTDLAHKLNIPIQDFLPETITLNNTNNQNSQGGLILGNIYTYNYHYSDKELAQENAFLKEKIQLLEEKNKQKENSLSETFFWQVVELSHENYEQAVELLAQKSLSVLFEFEEILAQKLYALDRQSFAQAIYGKRTISKDDFVYVRCFTVSQGQTYYEKVLNGEVPMLNQTFEPLLSLAEKAYFRKTAAEFPALRTSVSYETGNNQTYWS